MKELRIVIASDRQLSGMALAGLIAGIPGLSIIDQVDQVEAAKFYCLRGEADVIIIDASMIVNDDSSRRSVLASPSEANSRPELALVLGRPAHCVRFQWTFQACQLSSLTAREQEIFLLLGIGLSNRKIGILLRVSEATVKSHVGRILRKLNLESRLQAGLAAFAYSARLAWSHFSDMADYDQLEIAADITFPGALMLLADGDAEIA
jgi:DNA-binding NarL/FixJ family response regulator